MSQGWGIFLINQVVGSIHASIMFQSNGTDWEWIR